MYLGKSSILTSMCAPVQTKYGLVLSIPKNCETVPTAVVLKRSLRAPGYSFFAR
jgi:hypothetical protein